MGVPGRGSPSIHSRIRRPRTKPMDSMGLSNSRSDSRTAEHHITRSDGIPNSISHTSHRNGTIKRHGNDRRSCVGRHLRTDTIHGRHAVSTNDSLRASNDNSSAKSSVLTSLQLNKIFFIILSYKKQAYKKEDF